MTIGARQLELLFTMASPAMVLLTPRAEARSLARHGLLQPYGSTGEALRISPAGLRTLADALEHGALDRFMKPPAS